MEDESDDKDDTKRKSRNLSEKKRRDQFNTLVNDLNALISTSNRKMDKSTVLKSTIAFLKHHNEATDRSKVFEIQQDWKPSFLTNDEFTHLMLEALDGFIIVFSSNGSIHYASESITSLLGYLQRDILNMTIFDLTSDMDHENLFNIFLNPTPVIEPLQTDITASNQITFHAHMKRGGIDKVDTNAYELVKFVGYFRNDANVDNLPIKKNTQSTTHKMSYQSMQSTEVDKKLIFVGTGRVQTPQLIREMCAIDPTRNEFTSKHSMEWKFLFLDHRAPPIIGYMPFEVLGTSGYDYYHFDDLDSIVASHEDLMQKGEGKSCYYRFLTKGQQWIWLQTDFYVSYHQYNPKPEYVVCTHKVVSYAEVIKQCQPGRKSTKTIAVNVPATKPSTVTSKDIEPNSCSNMAAVIPSTVLGTGITGATPTSMLNSISPTLETVSMWPNAASSNTQAPQGTPLKSSRPSSSYDNISSSGISPNLKRKRYYHHSHDNESDFELVNISSAEISPNVKRKRYNHHSRGFESDSTSMSADSGTSRHSLLTHLSSHSRHRHHSMSHLSQHQNTAQQSQQQQHTSPHLQQHQQHAQQTSLHHQQQQQQNALRSITQVQAQPKLLPILQPHSLAAEQMVTTSTPCQFTQPAFPIRNPPIVGPTFLEPPQFLAAIPVQPVIAPFSVAPVSLSPITVSLPTMAAKSNPAFQTSFAQHQPEILPAAAVVMTPTQTHLQDQLQRKHDELQTLIMQQQDELRIVSEQLLLARYTLLQPVVPMNYNNASGGSTRNFNFGNNNNNTLEHHGFNQYEFTLNAEQEQQQLLLQQHQTQQQQQQHTLQQQPHVPLLPNTQQQPIQPPAQQQQQNLLSRSVPELEQFGQEEIDAFLNLSPLLGCTQTTLNSSSIHNNNNNQNLNSLNSSNNSSNMHAFGSTQHNEDSLLSYMQKATDPSPGLNFQMGLSEDESESHSGDTKLLNNHAQQNSHPQQQQHRQPPSSGYFSANPFQALNQSGSTHQMPNELEILPYQMSQEQSHNLFRSPHTPGTSQL